MKIILVTGASRGIGREIAKQLALKGHKVIANYNKSEEKAMELQKENQNIDIYKADVSKREEVKKMVQDIIKKYGKIDVLINNAGIDKWQLFTDITDEDWEEMISNNLNSAFYMSQEVVKDMISRKQGSIINISSIWGITGASCEVAYSVTKAAMDGLTKSLAKELAPSGIRVNSIAPGAIMTDMNKNLTNEEIEEVNEQIPLGKFGKPEDIAKCVNWLIEDEYTTGQVISPNGGWVI
ncbi:MAG: SDR family oxidoreductase [Clostridia bacterium]|nr:SDR family oxidoreductase [Clostridia bacterium]